MCGFVALMASQYSAQEISRYEGKASVVNAYTLKIDDKNFKLVGLSPLIESDLSINLEARKYLTRLAFGGEVACAIKGRKGLNVVAQCINSQERDISLMMIERGFGLVQQDEISELGLRNAYIEAEYKASEAGMGIWALQNESKVGSKGGVSLLRNDKALIISVAATITALLIGFALVSWVQYFMLKRLINLQKHQMATARGREKTLRERERFVLASALEGELNTNKAKLDAFLIIYEDMLNILQDPGKIPKYKKSGDVIHERPALTRTVYDSNLDKLDLLGNHVVSELTSLYVSIDPNPDYYTLEPDMPLDQVQEKVQKILQNAESMIEPLDRLLAAISITVRDKKGQNTAAVASTASSR